MKPLLSILCPVHNEEHTIPIFYERMKEVLQGLEARYDYEILFTNNASTDGTLTRLKALQEIDPKVRFLTFTRNFGYQASLAAGLRHVLGDLTFIIDVDGEDPPELLPELLAGYERGYDIVYGIRAKRKEFFLLHWLRKAFYRVTRWIADYDFVLDMAEFSLFTRRVREAALANQSTFAFLRADLGFVGFKRLGIPYERDRRVAGKTHYNLWRMSQFAFGGVLSSSTFFLRFALYLGVPLALLNWIVISLSLLGRWEGDLRLVFLADLSFIILVLAFLATYIARIYKNGVARPLFIVDWENSSR